MSKPKNQMITDLPKVFINTNEYTFPKYSCELFFSKNLFYVNLKLPYENTRYILNTYKFDSSNITISKGKYTIYLKKNKIYLILNFQNEKVEYFVLF